MQLHSVYEYGILHSVYEYGIQKDQRMIDTVIAILFDLFVVSCM